MLSSLEPPPTPASHQGKHRHDAIDKGDVGFRTQHYSRHRHKAVVCAKDEGAQPGRPVAEVIVRVLMDVIVGRRPTDDVGGFDIPVPPVDSVVALVTGRIITRANWGSLRVWHPQHMLQRNMHLVHHGSPNDRGALSRHLPQEYF